MDRVTWNILKSYSDNLSAPIIWSSEVICGDNAYHLHVAHKGQVWTTTLVSGANDSEIAEFEANYKGTITELRVSAEVSASTEEVDFYVPPAGAKIVVLAFYAEGAFKSDTACKLLWDYNEVGEQVVWATQGTAEMPGRYVISSATTDGIKKLAVSCDNGSPGPVLMSAYAKLLVINNA